MHPLIQALRSELVAIIARIDSGDCDISDIDDMDEVVSVIRKVSHTALIMNLAKAARKIL